MKTATVCDGRNRYTSLLSWIGAGEEIVITRRGKAKARLVPESKEFPWSVDGFQSPAVKRGRSGVATLTAAESLDLLHEAGGSFFLPSKPTGRDPRESRA